LVERFDGTARNTVSRRFIRPSEKPEKTIRILSELTVNILNLRNNLSQKSESETTMVRQHLTSRRPDEITAYREMRASALPLHKSLAVISSLLSSLTVAVDDLDASEMPPLNEDFDFYNEVQRFEILLIKKALRMTGGSQVKAAKLLKLNATTLNSKIKSYQIFAHD
jgi:transcriptional regulator with GAF, ATPase, and Fis domain